MWSRSMATTCALAETGLVMDSSSSPKRIVRLEQAVVNRIAAGEVRQSLFFLSTNEFCSKVIQRPSNAIKEMMENRLLILSVLCIMYLTGVMVNTCCQWDGFGDQTLHMNILCGLYFMIFEVVKKA